MDIKVFSLPCLPIDEKPPTAPDELQRTSKVAHIIEVVSLVGFGTLLLCLVLNTESQLIFFVKNLPISFSISPKRL